MRICMFGHVYPLPPKGYAGVERVVSWWIQEHRKAGLHITLIADAQSTIPVDRFLQKTPGEDAFVEPLCSVMDDIDVVHDNNDCHNPNPDRWKKPYLYTVHACVWPKNPNPVFLSRNQARWFKQEKAVINNNGLPLDEYPFFGEKEDFLLWCAGVRACKAPEMAIQLAQETKTKLYIIGPILDAQYAYLQGMNGLVEYLGPMDTERLWYYQHAAAFLYTCSPEWMEGFNLTNIEALLSGTPVIGLRTDNNTIVDEQIVNGESGFICDDYEEMKQVIEQRLYTKIHPLVCRWQGEKFDVRKTAERYRLLYMDALNGKRW